MMTTPLKTKFEEVRKLAPHPRGRAFEQWLGDVFSSEKIPRRLAYRPKGEEIDGAIWHLQRTILVEAKWVASPIPASSIYAFKGKVDGKFDGTIGIFLSMSGFSKDCAEALTHGKDLNILLFDQADIEAIAAGVKFSTIIEAKLFAAGQTGNVYIPWPELDNVRKFIASAAKPLVSTALDHPRLLISCEGPQDKLFLEALIAYVATETGKEIQPLFFVAHGKSHVMQSISPSLTLLLSQAISGPIAVITVFDADTSDVSEIEEQRQRAQEALKDLPPSWQSHVAIAIPELESWLGLTSRVSKAQIQRMLPDIDWEELIKRTPELQSLISFIQSAI